MKDADGEFLKGSRLAEHQPSCPRLPTRAASGMLCHRDALRRAAAPRAAEPTRGWSSRARRRNPAVSLNVFQVLFAPVLFPADAVLPAVHRTDWGRTLLAGAHGRSHSRTWHRSSPLPVPHPRVSPRSTGGNEPSLRAPGTRASASRELWYK